VIVLCRPISTQNFMVPRSLLQALYPPQKSEQPPI
jgi:hypothetical protein